MGGGAVHHGQDGAKDGTELQAWGITGPAEGTLPCVCVSGVEEALLAGWVQHLQQLISLVQLQEEVGGRGGEVGGGE